MSNYRRVFVAGGTYFFTVNLLQRQHNELLIQEIDLLRYIVKKVRNKYPFRIDAWVVLPDHLYCVWEHLIRDDLDYQRHIDVIHIHPMKHGLVKNVID